jgi:hypothetical protein
MEGVEYASLVYTRCGLLCNWFFSPDDVAFHVGTFRIISSS